MRASVLLAPGQVELREIPKPTPGPGEVVVQIKTALTCGTDLKAFLRGHPQIPWGSPFGHEFAGVIAAAGEGVQGFAVGDEVMSVHSAPCGACYWCHKGQGNLCTSIMDTKILGAFAEYIKVPAHIVRQNMFKKPPHLSWAEAALLEPLACVVYGLEQVRLQPGDTGVVIGAGPIGLLHQLVLQARGVKVLMLGRREYRLNMARQLGAAGVMDNSRPDAADAFLRLVREHTQGRGADLVVECTGQPAIWEGAVRYVRRGGDVILFGGPAKGTTVTFDCQRIHYDQITLHSPFHFDPAAVRKSYDLLATGQVDGKPLISATRPLADLQDVLVQLQTSDVVKIALLP
jgi:L-iditol 2-dehydrogenase